MTSEVNFTNILREVFTRADPKGTKYKVKVSVFFFALLESVRVKASRKMLLTLSLVGYFL